MIDGPPRIVRLAACAHEDLVEVPLLLWPGTYPLRPLSADLASEHRNGPIPPETHCLLRDVDAALIEQTLDVPQRKRKAVLHQHRKTNDLG